MALKKHKLAILIYRTLNRRLIGVNRGYTCDTRAPVRHLAYDTVTHGRLQPK